MHGNQGEFDFTSTADESGFIAWREQRRVALRRFACQAGLPLGHQVVVRLVDGIELSGLLRLKDEWLFLSRDADFGFELMVDGVTFKRAEIESCIRTA
jgi:hypothetical protein